MPEWVIRDIAFLNKALCLYSHDGNIEAPKGGILLFADTANPVSRFPTKQAAALAIDRTVKHRRKLGFTSGPEDYWIQDAVAFFDEVEFRQRKGKKK